jgi:hypothetical protein
MLTFLKKFYGDSLTYIDLVCMITSPDVSRSLNSEIAGPECLIIVSLVGGNRISVPPVSPGT